MSEAAGAVLEGIPNPGDVLVGKYRVERVLGVGGMGAVVSATHLQLEEKVAIKFLHAASALNPDSVARFLREGKAVIKIRSEHAVKVHDVGRLENGAPYLVMEHLEGCDLDQLLRERGPLPVVEVVDMILQACEAIAEGHSLGIIHRDLKPANLFLTRRADGSPCVKVLDFGISKAAPGAQNVTMTRTQTIMGSPRYMSPEQMRSTRAVDARTDVWSLGIILYELLSGSPPFNGESMTELCAQILEDVPTPLSRVTPGVAADLDAVVQGCLAKAPDRRYPSLAELANALAGFGSSSARASSERITRLLRGRTSIASTGPELRAEGTAPPFVPARTPVPQRTLDGAASTGARPSDRTLAWTLTGVVGGLLIAAAVAGVFFAMKSHDAPAAAAAAAAPAMPLATEPPAPPPAPARPAPPPTAPAEATSPPPPAVPAATTVAAAPSALPSTHAAPAPTAAAPQAAATAAPRKHAPHPPTPPPAPAADGMFDGRK